MCVYYIYRPIYVPKVGHDFVDMKGMLENTTVCGKYTRGQILLTNNEDLLHSTIPFIYTSELR